MTYPNIIYIHSHDTGRWIQPYGFSANTPNLQQLAEDGVLFRQAFCTNPTCSASRSSLLTGRYPHQNGMTGLAHLGFSLNDYRQHLLHLLRPLGYQSALAGIQHIADQTDQQEAWQVIGYDECLGDHPEAHTQAAEFIRRNHTSPFFLSVGFFETHRPFPELSDAHSAQYNAPPPLFPDTPQTRADMAAYKISVEQLDTKIGTVLNAVDQAGLTDNTLIICTTDHGPAFPNMKCRLTDAGTGVMLIMRGPNGISGGKVIDAMCSHLDIIPTLCDLLKLPAPAYLEGKSLLPLIQGQIEDLHQELFAEINYHVCYEPMRSIRTPRWKYIFSGEDRNKPVLPNCDDSATKLYWCEHGWSECTLKKEMLFDLIFDPLETNNLAENSAYQKIRSNLQKQMNQWMVRTEDPLRKGPVAAPPSAIIRQPDPPFEIRLA